MKKLFTGDVERETSGSKLRDVRAEEPARLRLTWDFWSNIGLIFFTMLGFLLTSMKYPEYGLLANLASEVFWLYSAWKSWKEANQFGILVTTVIITVILIWGVVNYWFL